jgi:hypothetical protein
MVASLLHEPLLSNLRSCLDTRLLPLACQATLILLSGLGTDVVFDYNKPKAVEWIHKLTKNMLRLVLDTISLQYSAQFYNMAIPTEGGEYSSLFDIVGNCYIFIQIYPCIHCNH